MSLLLRTVLLLATLAAACSARDLHVDPQAGAEKGDGVALPVKTIAQAIRLAEPGDTIHLAPGTYHESAEFGRKSGEADRPIILDGHGATLDGSEAVTAAEWETVEPGLYRKRHLLKRIDAAIVQRWFMLWDGRMNHMGRTSKGHLDPLKKPADLQPDEWTYVVDEDAFYLRLAPGRDLAAAQIRYPARSSGVAIGGAAHLVIRHLTCTHVINDGFNVHGSARDCRFENIAAVDCGDDGFSAHEDAECEIEGFVSTGNSTGFTDINASKTHYRRVRVEGCLAFDIFFQGNGEHSVRDAVIVSSATTALGLSGGSTPGPEPCRVTMENVYFERRGKTTRANVPASTKVDASRCTFVGLTFPEGVEAVTLRECALATAPGEVKGGADQARLRELGLLR